MTHESGILADPFPPALSLQSTLHLLPQQCPLYAKALSWLTEAHGKFSTSKTHQEEAAF